MLRGPIPNPSSLGSTPYHAGGSSLLSLLLAPGPVVWWPEIILITPSSNSCCQRSQIAIRVGALCRLLLQARLPQILETPRERGSCFTHLYISGHSAQCSKCFVNVVGCGEREQGSKRGRDMEGGGGRREGGRNTHRDAFIQ